MRLGLRVRRGLRDWRSYVPLIATLNSYQRQDLSHDIMAGLIVGMVTIPQAVAYALLLACHHNPDFMLACYLWCCTRYLVAQNN